MFVSPRGLTLILRQPRERLLCLFVCIRHHFLVARMALEQEGSCNLAGASAPPTTILTDADGSARLRLRKSVVVFRIFRALSLRVCRPGFRPDASMHCKLPACESTAWPRGKLEAQVTMLLSILLKPRPSIRFWVSCFRFSVAPRAASVEQWSQSSVEHRTRSAA